MDGIFDLELDLPGSSDEKHDFEEGNYSDTENHDDSFIDVETIDEPAGPATTSSTYEEIPFSEFTDKFPPNRITIDDFEMMKVLGRGGFGKVLKVKKKSGADKDSIYAMKVLKKAVLTKTTKDIEHAKAERNVLELADHPFICQMFYAFQTAEKLYLILEYMNGGELYMLLERENRLDDDDARFYVIEILLALEHLHLHGVIYRDLKPENVALTGRGHIRLIDFGLCKEDIWDGDKAHTYCGTLEYIAPEVILKQGHDHTADWWSLATLMFDMLTGGPPFRGDTRMETQDSILRKQPRFPRYIKPATQNLLYSMLRKKPEKRLGHAGAMEIKEHEFFDGVDWEEALEQKLTPPFLPCTDESRIFDPDVLRLPAVDSPCSSIPGSPAVNAFFGFSYMGQNGFAHQTNRTESSASDTTTTSTPSTTN
uniref:Non-specific serine/threonine protein kinase n=1 Tax=Panagrellus redivivus TaxID=6233 RepID=A0A7E4VKD0_PANRE